MCRFLLFLGFLTSLTTCSVNTPPNELHQSQSLYLQQHAANPVHWQMWSERALERAAAENKLLIVSIGYSSCHWCHVMEEESFEDHEVADLMNAHFISIKIDREERPDLDARFMSAVQLMSGQGGWPLNCVALPDGTPIWGGTYFSKADWMAALDQIATLWKEDPDKVREYGDNMRNGLTEMLEIGSAGQPSAFAKSDFEDVIVPWMRGWDTKWGGPNRAPKFPLPTNYNYLLDYGLLTGDTTITNYVYTTLNKMATGGIYDFVSGGMTRYSTDRFWKVPHFEKMLYDNAQLLATYARAYRATHSPLYANVLETTTQWLENDMKLTSGLYAAAMDADSPTPDDPREEGGYYTWTLEELQALSLPSFEHFKAYFDITPNTAWEGKYILHRPLTAAQYCRANELDLATFTSWEDQWRQLLLTAAAARSHSHPKPIRDPKALTTWNALLVVGWSEAHWAAPDRGYDTKALALMDAMRDQLRHADGLYHQWVEGQSSGTAFLDDFATYGQALLAAYTLSAQPAYLNEATEIAQKIWTGFERAQDSPFFLYSPENLPLWQQQVEIEDNVIPSANALLAHFYAQLSDFTGDSQWMEHSQAMVRHIHHRVFRYGPNFSEWLRLALREAFTHKELVVSGPQAREKLAQATATHYQPNSLHIWSETPSDLPLLEGRFLPETTRFFMCEGRTCQLPTESLDTALELWKK